MGNSLKKVDNISQLPNHPNLMNPEILTDKQQKLMMVSFTGQRKQFQAWKAKKIIYKQMIKNDRHLLWPRDSKFKPAGMCGHAGSFIITVPYCSVTLSEEIRNRRLTQTPFEEKELWYLLYSLVSLAEQLHRYAESIGDVRPLNILLNEKGEIKIITKLSLPPEKSNLEKVVQHQTPAFISPEQHKLVKKRQLQHPKTWPVSECFSIGLTLLSTALLEDGQEIYEPAGTFNNSLLQQFLNRFMTLTPYSQNFKLLVRGLLNMDVSKRLSAVQIHELLFDFEDKLYNLLPFEIKNFTPSLRRKLHLDKENDEGFGQVKQSGVFVDLQNKQQSSRFSFSNGNKPHYVSKKALDKITQYTSSQSRTSKRSLKDQPKDIPLTMNSPHQKLQGLQSNRKLDTERKQDNLQESQVRQSFKGQNPENQPSHSYKSMARNVDEEYTRKFFNRYAGLTKSNFQPRYENFNFTSSQNSRNWQKQSASKNYESYTKKFGQKQSQLLSQVTGKLQNEKNLNNPEKGLDKEQGNQQQSNNKRQQSDNNSQSRMREKYTREVYLDSQGKQVEEKLIQRTIFEPNGKSRVEKYRWNPKSEQYQLQNMDEKGKNMDLKQKNIDNQKNKQADNKENIPSQKDQPYNDYLSLYLPKNTYSMGKQLQRSNQQKLYA